MRARQQRERDGSVTLSVVLLAACCRHKGSVRVFGKLLPSLGLREDAARLFEAEGDDILYDEEKSGVG